MPDDEQSKPDPPIHLPFGTPTLPMGMKVRETGRETRANREAKTAPPPEPLPPEQLGQLLNAFVTTTSNWPDNPAPTIHLAQKQSKNAIVHTIKFGLPVPWHNVLDQLAASMTDDQTRAMAVIFTMAFVQGVGLETLQKQNGKR